MLYILFVFLIFLVENESKEKNAKVSKEIEKNILEREKELMKLYLESIYFPVELEEANNILIILQKRDYLRALFKVFILKIKILLFYIIFLVFKQRK